MIFFGEIRAKQKIVDGVEQRHRCWPPLVLQDDVQGVDDTGQVTKNSQEDVDKQVCTASTLQEDTQRGQDDGKNNLANVASGERHVDKVMTVEVGLYRAESSMGLF